MRTGSVKLRTVSCSFTSSGMMLYFVPPWIEPTVITVGSSGLISRATTDCSVTTMRAAMSTGSIVASGRAP